MNEQLRQGSGSELDPFRSQDKTAGIRKDLAALAERGGVLHLESGR